ncbi:MAG: DNA-directed RNA polymerase subunit beta [Tenericutes bacterium]|jgi:DNA-directed RNA polymerase subunit beta|nr:DNA-directed RNA polymerase subunit beta [Mycoplasmatota bacterium]
MAYKFEKFGSYRERASFSKWGNLLELTNLLEIQKKSYQWFVTDGVKEVLNDLFPIESFSGNLSLDFGDYVFESPKYSIKDCKDRNLTYASPLMVQARLFNNETGEVKEQEIFLGNIPLMTENGTFIVNGAERVIVSQLVRSPSVYYTKEIDKNGRAVFACQVIPTRGTWLEFEMDSRDVFYVRIDRTRKVPITTLLRTFGLSTDEEIKEAFGEDPYIINTIDKDSTKNTDQALIEIYEKLRPGEPATLDSAKNHLITKFFDEFKYDLAKVGRYKFNKKLDVCDRLLGCKLAEKIKIKGKVIVDEGTVITKDILEEIRPIFKEGYNVKELKINETLDTYNKVQTIKVYSKLNPDKVVEIIGNDQNLIIKRLTISDVYASVSYYLNLLQGIGNIDEIDHLANRRVRQVGELLQNQFRIGLARTERIIRDKMSTVDLSTATPKNLVNIRPLTAVIKELFGSSQLSQFMDQQNPIAELTNKRRLSALGPGGLSRDRAGMEVRDVNESHYGRICPIESPEGQNIGLITSLASYAKINDYGFIMTPYAKVKDYKVYKDNIEYLTADEENDYMISQAGVKLGEDGTILEDNVVVRYKGDTIMAKKEEVDYIDVSPQQIVSITASCIPFLDNDDATRTLMGANMQRQALPLLKTEAPLVATGVEHIAAKDSGAVVIAKADGIVDYVDSTKIVVKNKEAKDVYYLKNYERSNVATCYHQIPIVRVGDVVKAGMVIGDGPSTDKGELALGKNVVIAFMTFDGYNYEDAVVINERIVKDDAYTSLKIENYEIQCRETKLGPEEITRDIPNVSEENRKNLDINGIIRIGTEVFEGDILVGKVTPKGMVELTSEEKLLHAIFGEKTREVRDTSLRVEHGEGGIVHDIKITTKKESDELPSGVNMVVRVSIIQKRKVSVGDKMAGRHGNKGVVSLVLPQEDMPYMADGRPVDILLNSQGVPSRMNIGQILELHLGMAAKSLGIHTATPVFDGATLDDIKDLMKEAKMDEDGKMVLYDGRTGEPFDNRISVGVMYMIKLHHMVDDKIHARSTGPYSLVTQQPLGGKAQFGGQRFGEMEVWALYAYGAANILQEILTIKSDDVVGRVKTYESLVKGNPIQPPGLPESFRVLIKEFQALGLNISLINEKDEEVDLKQLEDEETRENVLLSIEEIKDDVKEELPLVEEKVVEEKVVEEDLEMDFSDIEEGGDE